MNEIQEILLKWYASNRRELPWRDHPTPYEVWISEIILQQTRVAQGFDYYLRFVTRWPSFAELAKASEEEVLKMWQGLGYYSRARNLHKCAQQVVEQHYGNLPADFEQLKHLKGIGNYTAAAIASIAFDLPHAVVDGNVYRVLSRLFDETTPININKGQQLFAQLADDMLNKDHPGLHNQAMMEFGALQCLPKNPDCLNCPLQAHCLAFANKTVDQRPVKVDKVKVTERHFYYLVIRTDGEHVYLHHREGNDIWKNMYDFPLVECNETMSVEQVVQTNGFKQIIENNSFTISKVSPTFTHKLTHQTIRAQFIEIKLSEKLAHIETKNILLTPEKDLDKFPIPRLIELYLIN